MRLAQTNAQTERERLESYHSQVRETTSHFTLERLHTITHTNRIPNHIFMQLGSRLNHLDYPCIRTQTKQRIQTNTQPKYMNMQQRFYDNDIRPDDKTAYKLHSEAHTISSTWKHIPGIDSGKGLTPEPNPSSYNHLRHNQRFQHNKPPQTVNTKRYRYNL